MSDDLRYAETVVGLRETEPGSRIIEGVAFPYGVESNLADLDGRGTIGKETIAPGAFRDNIEHWAQRKDGARVVYRARHRERPIGTVIAMRDEADGVHFQAKIMTGPRGDEYLAEVGEGINGVSGEFVPASTTRLRNGLSVVRQGKIMGIAGSDAPAYDGARVALRDMEDPQVTEQAAPEPKAPETHGAVPPMAPAERDAAERAAAAQILGTHITSNMQPEVVYRPDGDQSFLRDGFTVAHGHDQDAYERLRKHNAHLYDVALAMERDAAAKALSPVYNERAGDLLSSEIPGAYPNDYLPGLLTPRILKGRPMGDFYSKFPIADARPKIFAKVTTSTSVAVQSAEGAALSVTDLATTAVTANPLMYGATIDVSRQVLDGASPSALAMVYQDLIEAYAQASETVIKTAVEAGSTASGVAITAATPYAGTLSNVINYFGVRFKGATGAFIPSALFPVLAAQGDSTGRPFLPAIGAVNSDGTTQASDTSLELAVLTARTKLSYASTANVCVFGRPNDFVIYESPIATFSYDQVVGPQAVRIGLWAYLVVAARLGSLKVTAA